jgi:hypothetical protein
MKTRPRKRRLTNPGSIKVRRIRDLREAAGTCLKCADVPARKGFKYCQTCARGEAARSCARRAAVRAARLPLAFPMVFG